MVTGQVMFAQTQATDTTTKQKVPYVFVANKFKNDYQKVIGMKSRFDTYHKRWAQELAKQFPVDKNGAIHLDYIIVCNQELDIQKTMEVSVGYFDYAFSSSNAIERCDYEHSIIVAHGRYSKIAEDNTNAIYYFKSVTINVDTDIVIRFKENRIRMEVIIRHYNIISADSLLNSKNALVSVNEVFPFEDSGDKYAYARAFINSYANSFDKIDKYIEYMNANMTDAFDMSDDEW